MGHIIILSAFLVFILLARPAYSYIDPGSGSYFLQILIASLLGMGFVLKEYFGKIKDFVSKNILRK